MPFPLLLTGSDMERIKEDELSGFEYILKDAIKKAGDLVQG
jgi:hypothetical protein